MGNIIKIVLWLLIASELFCQNFSDEREKGSIGIGFQISYPFYGLSVIVAPEMDFSFQGMFGLLGKIKSYCGKVRYHIEESGVYAYALIGAKEYETTNYIDGLSEKKIETFFGYGIGFGIEYLVPKIPIWYNVEVGYGNIKYNDPTSDSHAIMLGIGLHYYFPEQGF